jgi:UDP-glucose 4-epimerase
MQKYLVTGAMGFIGSHWCEHLLKKGKLVYGIDLGPHYPKLMEYDNFVYIHDTIKNYKILEKAVKQVDCVCHLAGIATPYQYVKFPRKVMDITAVAGIELIEMCRLSGKLFFFTSTSEIYGKSENVPFKEDGDRVLGSTTTKRWCYSTAKALLEHYLDACAYSKELDNIIVRLFNVYGPRLRSRVVSDFIQNTLSGEDIVVHGEGEQTRSFTYIDDVIEAFDLLMDNPNCYNQIYNVGSPSETSINELVETINKVGNFTSEIKYMPHHQYYGESYEDIERRVPDISKIKEYTGWSPKTSLEEGIAQTIEYMRNNKNE